MGAMGWRVKLKEQRKTVPVGLDADLFLRTRERLQGESAISGRLGLSPPWFDFLAKTKTKKSQVTHNHHLKENRREAGLVKTKLCFVNLKEVRLHAKAVSPGSPGSRFF